MNKRDFIRTAALAALGVAAAPLAAYTAGTAYRGRSRKRKWKHWVWIHPKPIEDEAALSETYKKYRAAGIRGIFFEADSEPHFRLAHQNKLEAHRWLVVNKRFDPVLMAAHPEWYVVNRNNVSCIEKPAYVERYRWLCPTRAEVRQFLEAEVEAILLQPYVDGIHLDCIRFPDVALPVGLWEKYGLDLTKELPEHDYCYCSVCREKYSRQSGIDPMGVQYADQSPGWRRFRYEQVNELVAGLVKVARRHRKPVTAAVFPTPEIAKRLVRQDWTAWQLDAACPMIYHAQYREPTNWIGQAVAEGRAAVDGRFPLFAGILTSYFRDAEDFKAGIRHALQGGAKGVTIFGPLNDAFLEALRTA